MRTKRKKLRSQRQKHHVILSVAAVILVGFGIWFSTINAYTFLKGYFLFQSAQITSAETPKKIKENIQEETKNKELYSSRPNVGDNIGKLYIPKLEMELPIYHGTNEDELEKGIGHFAGSVLLGEKDNSVLSGHRDTVFRRLGEVGKGDLLVVTTSAGEFTYKIKNVRIVDKEDRSVIVPKPKATLTVSTCYPFQYIGAAPERYILVSELIDSTIY
jgi:sortase A